MKKSKYRELKKEREGNEEKETIKQKSIDEKSKKRGKKCKQ